MNAQLYQIFIGSLLVKPEFIKNVWITSEYLPKPFNELFEKICGVIRKTGLATIQDCISAGVDISEYSTCVDMVIVPNKKEFERYQTLIVEVYKKAKALQLAGELKGGLLEFDEFEKEIGKLRELKSVETSIVTAKELESTLKNPKIAIKFAKYRKFMALTNIKQNDFVVIAAGTGKGKSSFALNLMNDLSNNYPCIYINMEMAHDEALFRIMGSNTGIEISKLESYSINHNSIEGDDIEHLETFFESYENRGVEMFNKSMTLDQIKAIISSHDSKNHFIVFIDHMGLIGYRGDSYERMTVIAKEMRKLSLDYNCTIFALHQLSRNGQQGSEPKLSDLRDSGEVEQSASRVVFLHEMDDGGYKVIVAKNRGGRKGDFFVRFKKSTQQFFEN